MSIFVISEVYTIIIQCHNYHYTNLTFVSESVSVYDRKVTGSYLTRPKKATFFASLYFDAIQAVD